MKAHVELVHEGKKPNSNNIKEVLNDVSLQHWRNIETNEMPVLENKVLEESTELIHNTSEKNIEKKQGFVDTSEKSLEEKEIGETLKSNEMVVINKKVSEEANDSVHVKNNHQSCNSDCRSEDKNDMKSNLESVHEGKIIKKSKHQCPFCDFNGIQVTNHMKSHKNKFKTIASQSDRNAEHR